MIDELMDSLLVEHLPTLAMLEESLAELCKGAEDIDPILHSFKNAQHLRVGVRDMLGKDDIRSTHAALADIAEACLKQIAEREYVKLVDKFGFPTIGRPSDEDLANEISRQLLGALRRPRRRHVRAGRARARQARRPRAELPQRSRPHLPVRSGRRNDGRPPHSGERLAATTARSTATSSASSASG